MGQTLGCPQPVSTRAQNAALLSRASLLFSSCHPVCCHRAIDDVYVLCELEGSMHQTRYVIQQLDEATVDFRKVCALNCRTPGMALAGFLLATLAHSHICSVSMALATTAGQAQLCLLGTVSINGPTSWCSV